MGGDGDQRQSDTIAPAVPCARLGRERPRRPDFPVDLPATRGPADAPHVLVLVAAHTAPHGLHVEYEGTCEAKLRQSGGERYSRFFVSNVDPVWCKGLAGHDTTASACYSVSSPKGRRISLGRGFVPAAGPPVPRIPVLRSRSAAGADRVAVPVRAAPWDLAWYRGGQVPNDGRTPLPPPLHRSTRLTHPLSTRTPTPVPRSTPPSHVSPPGIARSRPSLARYPIRETALPFPSVSWPLKDCHGRYMRPRPPLADPGGISPSNLTTGIIFVSFDGGVRVSPTSATHEPSSSSAETPVLDLSPPRLRVRWHPPKVFTSSLDPLFLVRRLGLRSSVTFRPSLPLGSRHPGPNIRQGEREDPFSNRV